MMSDARSPTTDEDDRQQDDDNLTTLCATNNHLLHHHHQHDPPKPNPSTMASPPASPSPNPPPDFPNTASTSSPAPEPEPSVNPGPTITSTAPPDINHPPQIGLGINSPAAAAPSKPEHHPYPPALAPLFTTSTLKPADTDLSWLPPAGLHIPRPNHENLVIFRRAVGINSTMAGSADPKSLEEGRKKAVGIYAVALGEVRRKKVMYHVLSAVINASHVMQIVIGASLTAL